MSTPASDARRLVENVDTLLWLSSAAIADLRAGNVPPPAGQ
jgi:hypothetical protein